MTGANDRASVWCIVQSDGDRSHLSPLNHLDVRRVPIQYCCIGERITLLQQTMQRALRITAPPRVVVTLAAGHRAYWAGPLWSVPAHCRVIDESTGRHTISLAVASTLIEKADSQALAVLMPADAFCANDWALHSGIQAALQALERLPRHLLALALEPPQHGEPQDYLVRGDFDGFPGRAVARCVRRPSTPIGRRLAAAGACINSGVYITRIKTLTEMLENHWPAMLDGVTHSKGKHERHHHPRAIRRRRVSATLATYLVTATGHAPASTTGAEHGMVLADIGGRPRTASHRLS
jgi:mannose-1-phosphate guanylyltransferase